MQFKSRPVRLRDMASVLRQLPQHKPWMVAIGGIASVVIMAICGFGSWMLLREEAVAIGPTQDPHAPQYRDISSRTVDPEPLTIADVFPDQQIVADPAYSPYTLVGEPQASADCTIAAEGDVVSVLAKYGCNQVIRATFTSPDSRYLINAGIFNLTDGESTAAADQEMKAATESGRGRIKGYNPTGETKYRPLGLADPMLTWHIRGHFLVYALIVRADSGDLGPEDQVYINMIRYDLVDKYLKEQRLNEWALLPATPGPSGDPSATPGSASAPASANP